MIRVDLDHRLGAFHLQTRFDASNGLTVLFGPSGSGKTSVINAVAGLIRASGRIEVNGQVLQDSAAGLWTPPHQRRVGYVFQDARLFPHLSVRQNLLYGRWFAKNRAAPSRVIDMLGLAPLLSRRPAALSGGEKQRVAIGRALLSDPALILADEPLASLDEARKSDILPYFERLRDEAGLPILYVTHSMAELARLATTVVTLDKGQVTRTGPADALLGDPEFTPQGARAAGAILTARVKAHHPDGLSELDAQSTALFLPKVPNAQGDTLRIRVAAQDVILARTRPTGLSALNILPATVLSVRTGTGPGALVSLDTPAGRLLARVTKRSLTQLALGPGVDCFAIIKTLATAPQDVGAPGL